MHTWREIMIDVDIKELIRHKEKEGKVVLNTLEGLVEADLEEFIKQPAEGILYDLNRDRATVMQFIKDEKWINDYACALVIMKLKEKLEQHPSVILAGRA